MIKPADNPVGDCKEGTYGVICSACMPGYARSGSFGCAQCPDPLINLLRVIGIILILAFIVALLVRSTINSATRKNTHSVYLKIFMNHLQLLAICASFKFEWPSFVEDFFSSGSFIVSAQESIVSFDCFMDTRDPLSIQRYFFRTGEKEIRVIYQKLFIMAFAPILLAVLVITFWGILLKKRNKLD